MSLITRCPACDTMFKVVPDQLRISDGWVRCGQCGEIFNASQHLLGTGTPSPAPAPPPSPFPASAAPAMQSPAFGTVAPVPLSDNPIPTAAIHPLTDAPRVSAAVPALAERDLDALASDHGPKEPSWSDSPPTPATPPTPFALPDSPSYEIPFAPIPDPESIEPPSGHDADADVSFLRNGAAGNSFWKRRSVRIALFLLAMALGAALVAQVLIQERNRIVQVEPAARPVLAALCAVAGCELGSLQQIESIVIDSSSFGRLRADNYRLAFSLRNTAPVTVAMPAIELSLTDTQDQALVRRVILPTEFGAPASALPAGSDWNGTLTLSLRPGASTERIAGYRLLAFYP